MLSILFLSFGSCLIFLVFKRNNRSFKLLNGIFILFINLFLIEAVSYGALLFLVNRQESFFLIGHQQTLDHLIKSRIVEAMYSNPGHTNNFYTVDNELSYTVGKGKEYIRYLQKDQRIFYIKEGVKEGLADKSSPQGLRALRNYSLVPPRDTLRVAAFGDSFVFGDYQPEHTIWTHFLEKSMGQLEVLNFGVSGYGLGQSYLRYLKDGLRYNPDVVIFNYILLGPRDEVVSEVSKENRLNLKHSAFYRVQLREEDGHLLTHAVTPFDYFHRPFMREQLEKILGFDPQKSFLSSDLFRFSNTALVVKYMIWSNIARGKTIEYKDNDIQLNVLLLDNLLSVARANNSQVIFFCAGNFSELPEAVRRKLFEYKDRVEYIDSQRALEAKFAEKNVKRENLLNPTNHYNALGNVYYAEVIMRFLAGREYWGAGERTFKFDKETGKFVKIVNSEQ
ncbi:MAG: SGNH/GDSL hydrolase family protein [Candidatus Omnitrophota bacterium]